MKKYLRYALIIIMFSANNLYADDIYFKEGTHYTKLKKPIVTEVEYGKVEVKELFWYYCPHCFSIENAVKKYIKNKPDNVSFILQPAVFSDRWVSGAIFYYVLVELGKITQLHDKLFKAIHLDNILFSDKNDFINWLAINGVDKEQASKVFSSFSIYTKVNKARIKSKEYKLRGVPAFVINGKYTTSVSQAGSKDKLFKVIKYLTDKESKINSL